MKTSAKLNEISNAILDKDIEVVSFDLFDTLVVRPCIEPTDLFKIVARRMKFEGDFVSIRKIAEQYARKKKVYYYDDVIIDEIYEEFMQLTNISKTEASKIMQCELEVEYDYIYPRYSIRELYNQAKENGKKVIIVTDVYLPRKFIEKVLEKNEISGFYKLYVSSEERLSKGSGRLFQKIIAELNREEIDKENIVHLGDNTRADVAIPKSLGIKSFHLPNAIGIFNSKKNFKPLFEFGKRTDSCYLVGALANYLFDDPYFPFNVDSISGGEEKLFGAVLYGPIILSYTKWLIENCVKDKVDKLFFVMRDGYLIEKVFNQLAQVYGNVPKSDKIYLSRKIRYYFYGNEYNGLLNSFMRFEVPEKMTVNEFMEKRLLLNKEDKDSIWKIFREVGYPDIDCPMGKSIEYYSIIPKLQKVFEEQVSDEVKIIKEYCNEKVQDVKKPAFVDVGYRGSVSEFLYDKMGISNIGYQIMEIPLSNQHVGKEYDIKSFFSYTFKNVRDLQILHPLTEDIISVQEGTAIKIEKSKNNFEILKAEHLGKNETLTQIQEGVLDFINYAFEVLKKDFIDLRFDESLFFEMLFDFLRKPNSVDVKVVKKLAFIESDFIKIDSDKNIYMKWVEEKSKVKQEIPIKRSQTEENLEVNNVEIQPWEKISKGHLLAIKICEKLHIIKLAIKVKKKLLHNRIKKRKNAENIKKIFELPINEVIANITYSWSSADDTKAKVLVSGHMVSFDKGICNYLNKLAQCMNKCDLILMSECSHLGEERVRQKIDIPFFIVPQFLGKDRYIIDTGIVCDEKVRKYVKKKTYLRWSVDNLIKRHEDMEEAYAYYFVYYAEKFVNEMLDVLNPKYVILWNQFFAFHHIFKHICQERGIKVIYFEFGSLPGTISIERLGQMGESFPGKFPEEFNKLDVSQEEIEKTKEILKFLKNSKLNRNIQPINNNIDLIKQCINTNRPTILYAGVNDYESGLVPYTKETEISHSPIFKSSEEALAALQKYAEKYNYNLIYKPHPIIEKQMNMKKDFGKNTYLALNIDINDVIDIADVVVTILSQVSYTALIRQKPVVMLGYTQLKGKGCCYEVFRENDMEAKLMKAITEGYSSEMQEKFVKHIAQMNKYNLYDDMQAKPLQYGMSIQEAIKYIFECDDTYEWYAKWK